MGFIAKWRLRKAERENRVEVSEENGVRFMHLGTHTVQSAMRIAQPYDLELAYSRAMMAFLLFHPEPRHAVFVGLGGGSLQKFIHHYLPDTRCFTLEIDPQVVTAARTYFEVPDDDERFTVEIADAAFYLAGREAICDVLMVDGFDGVALPEELSSQTFYDHCAAALTDDGVLVANLWASDPGFDVCLQRLETSFEGRVLMVPAGKQSNVAVMAFKRSPGAPKWAELRERAKRFQQMYGLEFLSFVELLRESNLHTEKRLLV